jgi:hypothetical protein
MKSLLRPLLAGILIAAAGSAVADRITFYQDDNYRERRQSSLAEANTTERSSAMSYASIGTSPTLERSADVYR